MRAINNSTIAGGYASASSDASSVAAGADAIDALLVLPIDLIIVLIQWNVEIC